MKVIETPRLTLRRFTLDDAEFVLALLNEPSFLQFIGDRGVGNIDDAKDYILKGPIASYKRNGFGLYVCELQDDGRSIGICGLLRRDSLEDVDIGFAFLPAFWGNGYAYEAASAVLGYAEEELGLSRIVAITVSENHRSIRVLEKLGMSFERTTRLAGEDHDVELYAIEVNRLKSVVH